MLWRGLEIYQLTGMLYSMSARPESSDQGDGRLLQHITLEHCTASPAETQKFVAPRGPFFSCSTVLYCTEL